ncbi:TetR/AcrR family transcriptional regulator [Rhodococcus sp. 05-339-2]|uniref:TetR/AcrR family transcriptional regulator n=1 Tax=Rhodococcoides fascians TaxID=1828 RepID=UPI00050C5184|nr:MULTISPECIES: TetR/AcrR family transcriptional regulator [Rhodococcus]OZD84664.1 TetR/AcrR family transcriptional regulator [Rhodococcus sp. 05-339-2]
MTTVKTRRRPGLERVLATADRLFYERGIHATGVDLIADEAGVSKTTMYTYFRTKDDLVAAYLQGRSDRWQRHVAEQLEVRGGSSTDKALSVFDLLGEWFGTDDFRGCPFINAEAESAPDAPGHQVNLGHRGWVRYLFAELLRPLGVTSSDEMLILQLTTLYDGAMASAYAEPGPSWAHAAREAARGLIDRFETEQPPVR